MLEFFRKFTDMSKPNSQAPDNGSSDEDFESMAEGFAGFDIDPYRLEGFNV